MKRLCTCIATTLIAAVPTSRAPAQDYHGDEPHSGNEVGPQSAFMIELICDRVSLPNFTKNVRLALAAITSTIVFIGAVAFALRSQADEGYHLHNHDRFHETFYKQLIRPDTGNPCCDGTECRPTSGRMAGDRYEVKVDGAWVPVPQNKIVKQTAPDLGYQVCAPATLNVQPHQLFCVVLPPES